MIAYAQELALAIGVGTACAVIPYLVLRWLERKDD